MRGMNSYKFLNQLIQKHRSKKRTIEYLPTFGEISPQTYSNNFLCRRGIRFVNTLLRHGRIFCTQYLLKSAAPGNFPRSLSKYFKGSLEFKRSEVR